MNRCKRHGVCTILWYSSGKQKEYDRLTFQLKKRKADLEKLKLELRDVKCDATALGLDQFPEEERLQTVKGVSNRPVFAKNTVRHWQPCARVVAGGEGARWVSGSNGRPWRAIDTACTPLQCIVWLHI